MKIAITALGTRGDLQPFIALGLGLQQAGYDVLLISSKNEQAFAESFGLRYHALDVDIQQMMESDDAQAMTKADNPIAFVTTHLNSSRNLQQTMIAVQEEVWQACQGADAIVYHPGMSNGFFMAQQLGIPCIMASPFPVTPTDDYPAILFYDGVRLGKLYNRLTHFIFEKVFWALSKSAVKAFWQRHSKPDIVTSSPPTRLQVLSGMPVVYGYSEHLFHRPRAWQPNIHITGSWTIQHEPAWTPPDDLQRFIHAGQPPVYIGFGSIKSPSTFKATVDIVLEALALSQQRGIVALGWNRLTSKVSLPDTVFLLESAPHTWLFPQMAAVVHHGGAGTTAAGLRAGKPTVIIPHTADQPAWGRRVYELGVGSKPIPRKKLNAENLTEAIQAALAPAVVAEAEALGKKLRTENGTAVAVGIIDAFLKKKS